MVVTTEFNCDLVLTKNNTFVNLHLKLLSLHFWIIYPSEEHVKDVSVLNLGLESGNL